MLSNWSYFLERGFNFVLQWILNVQRKRNTDGALVRAPVSHQCGAGSIPARCHMWVKLDVGPAALLREFFSGFSGFPSSTKNSIIFQIPIQYCNLVLFIIFLASYIALICTWVIVIKKSNFCLIPGHLFHFPEGFILCSSAWGPRDHLHLVVT